MTVFFLTQKKKMVEKKKDREKDDSETGVDQETSNNKETATNGEGNDEKTGLNIIKKVVSKEDSEKTGDQKKELRNSQEETEKKPAKEGEFIGEEITSKISFGKKINQLEEALKKLREEST